VTALRNRLIAIGGAKGSPGCSFLAAALAHCLVDSKIPTLLVDGDAEGSGLAALLGLGSTAPADGFAGPARLTTLDADTLLQSAVQVSERLWFSELGGSDGAALDGIELAAVARAGYKAVVLDLGHSAERLQRHLAAASDWLLWVVVPDRGGLDRADRALASGQLAAASAGLVFNRIRRGCLAGAEQLLSSRHRMPVMARIKENGRVAIRVAEGKPTHRLRGVHRSLRELARCVHPDALPAGPAWP
jgi:CO dehydrogenase nickel-insertion accessory protein CooC1